jgi:hypothetical protein
MKKIGLVLLVVGVIISIYSGFHYTTQEKIIEIGTIEIKREKDNYLTWSPYLGAVCIVAGLGIFFFSNKKN